MSHAPADPTPPFKYAPDIPNADLLDVYQRTDGEPGNPEADLLLAEIERRVLDV